MCGIAGILRTWRPGDTPPAHLEAIPEAWLDVLDDSIKHRGPDGRGRFRQRVIRPDGTIVDVALVHRRLSIIDHADGAQPMVIGTPAEPLAPAMGQATPPPHHPPLLSREGRPYQPLSDHTCPKCGPGLTAVVFNGCVYNHRELRAELEAAGHTFHTDHSDTEVLLHGWREWGRNVVQRPHGMYSFTIWDASLAAIYAFRDHWGEKPLYEFAQTDSPNATYALSSSAAGLARLTRAMQQHKPIQVQLVHQWIAMGWSPSDTPIQSIRQIPAGGQGVVPWGLKDCPWINSPPRADLRSAHVPAMPIQDADDAERRLRQAVESQLVADVPVGCFLSGGVDSSLIAHFANQALGQLNTFSVRMPDHAYDESGHATRAAAHIGTTHHTLECNPNPAHDLVHLIAELGLPFGDSSLLPSSWISRAARHSVPVVLTGDGGDEMFYGYERQMVADRLQTLRKARPLLRLIPDSVLLGRNPKSRMAKAVRLARAAAHREYQDLVAIFQTPDLARLAGRRATHWHREGMFQTDSGRAYDAAHYLPGDLMRKTDTASMAHALEARAPFLARDLAAAAMATPRKILTPQGQRKGLLRAVARRHLPAEIVDRPKMGFAIPIGEWFRSDYGNMRQLLYDHLESADPFPGLAEAGVEINMDFVRQMLREHDAAGERSINPWHGRDHSQPLYMLAVLSIWCKWLESL